MLSFNAIGYKAPKAPKPQDGPGVLIDLFSSFRTVLEKSRGSEFCDNLISSCIFLRLICPALLSPSLFGLISAFPSEPACQRNLTLLAKSLQTLANFSTFDDKEPYMRFLNGYVTSQLSSMRSFIRSISTSSNNDHTTDKVNIVHGSDTNIEATTGISNALSDSLSTTNADQTRSTLTATLPTPTTSTATTTAKATSQNNIKDTIDESCELANLHVILSDVIFRDSLTTPSVTITNNTHTNTNANTTAPDVNTTNGHNGITIDAHEVNSSTQGIVSPIFLKPVCPTIVTNLPEELCSLPRILDDISRALQQITSSECKQYDKTTSVNHTHTILMNTNDYSLSHHQKGGSSSSVMQSNISPSSSSPKHHKSKKFDHDREQPSSSSLSPVHHIHHHSHQYTSVAGGGGNTPYYTVHYNPGFHYPDSYCKVGLNNNNATNTATTTSNSSTGLLLPQLKQSASLTGLPSSDVSQSNPNDYDEPYMSPESDCDDMHETGVNSDHEVISKKAQTGTSSSCITSTFQSYSSSLSIANNSSLTTNYNINKTNNNKTNGYSSKDKKIYDHKSISLDKLNNSDNEHIYDMVPLSSSSSTSASSSSPSASPSRDALHRMNGVNTANDSYIHQPDQVSNCNNDATLTSMNHVTLNIEKDNDSIIQTKTGGDAVNSNIIIEQTPTSLSSSSLTALSNKITTSNENVQYNHHHHHDDEPDVVADDEINKFNQRNVCKSISPKLFLKKQVTTANVILTKPNVMSSSSIDTTKISKLTATTTTATHFRSNSSSRENMFDGNNINGDHFSFGASNTVQVNLTPHSPTHKVYNTNPNNYNNNNTDNTVDNFVCHRQHTHRKNASSEELYSYTHSENNNYDMHDTAAVVVDDVDVDDEEENSTTSTTVMNSMKKPNRKQPSELAVEIALLRYELLLSRQDALRAADRLSKQETEIYQLRQLLEQLRNNNNSKQKNKQSIELKLQNSDNNYDTLLNTTHVNDEMMMTMSCSQHQGSDPQLSSVKQQNNTRDRVGDGVGGVVNNSCLQNPPNTHSKVLQSVTATFKELDDAMARLELEQSELLREQARIRARIAATHRHQHQHQHHHHQQQQPITSCTQSIINPTVASKSKSLIRPKYFQSSIPKILIDSEKSRELPSPGHMNYINSPRTNISNNNYIQKTSICSELKSAPKK
ncbi:unnamed protein product [Trichobilharzia szidati]|nr:unnamed protein product [Trichobilharzia szidati]